MKIDTLENLFFVLLSDIYFVEEQLLKAMPEMAKKAQSEELKAGIETHTAETKEQIARLNEIFDILGQQPQRVDWINTMTVLFEKSRALLEQNTSSPALDAAIIVLAQRIEHFEIATYGSLAEFADVLGYDEIADILEETLNEESKTDKLLTSLAEGGFFKTGINEEAVRTK
jgi:ferritin-like metal-binding protein YciE